LDARHDRAPALQVRREVRVAACGSLLDERLDPVPDHRPVADGDRLAARYPEEPVQRHALGQVAQALRRVLHVAGVDVDHGSVIRLGPRTLDERGDASERVDPAVDVVRMQDDQPAHGRGR
jgi:hypothetical protein